MSRVRLYQSLRTAHLERAHELVPATILFSERRYDFDQESARGLQLVDGRGLRAAVYLLRHPVRAVEVNEPLMSESSLWTLSGLVALRLAGLLGRQTRASVVTYAIENRDPSETPRPQALRSRFKRALRTRAAELVWARLDRIAYGTQDAEALYRSRFGSAHPTSCVIPALPTPAEDALSLRSRPPTALFVSALVHRKGLDLLLAAWPQVRSCVSGARLKIIGSGALRDVVAQAAADDPSIELVVDPPRASVRNALSAARVVVLPSRRTPSWREQVGLPIVEGLSYGCTIVTTTETGLASWLAEHGHRVIRPDDGQALTDALVSALAEPLPAEQVLASLPQRDGRLAADDWLFGSAPDASSPQRRSSTTASTGPDQVLTTE